MNHKSTNGYTMIELLIVIAIIAIVAIGALIGRQLQLNKAYDTLRKSDLNEIRNGFENYYADHNCYPKQEDIDTCDDTNLAPYISHVPCDPTTKQPYRVINELNAACPQKFMVYANVDNPNDPDAKKLNCDSVIGQASSNTLIAELRAGCTNFQSCYVAYYGCVNGTCVPVSTIVPICSPNYCESNCQNLCGSPASPQNQCEY